MPVWSSFATFKRTLYERKDDPEPSLDEFQPDPDRPKKIIEDIVSAINKGTPVMVDGNEGRKSVAIIDAIYKSSKTGKVVSLG